MAGFAKEAVTPGLQDFFKPAVAIKQALLEIEDADFRHPSAQTDPHHEGGNGKDDDRTDQFFAQ